MTTLLTIPELNEFRETHELAMHGTCQIYKTVTGATDSLGNPVITWAKQGDVQPCGYRVASARDILPPSNQPQHDAVLRLPIDAPLSPGNRIKILTKWLDIAVDQDFEIVGDIEGGAGALVVRVLSLTDGSVLPP